MTATLIKAAAGDLRPANITSEQQTIHFDPFRGDGAAQTLGTDVSRAAPAARSYPARHWDTPVNSGCVLLSANGLESGDVIECVLGRLYLTSCGGILGRHRAAALIPSRGSFKDYCRGGKEAINLCLPNGIQLSFKALEMF